MELEERYGIVESQRLHRGGFEYSGILDVKKRRLAHWGQSRYTAHHHSFRRSIRSSYADLLRGCEHLHWVDIEEGIPLSPFLSASWLEEGKPFVLVPATEREEL